MYDVMLFIDTRTERKDFPPANCQVEKSKLGVFVCNGKVDFFVYSRTTSGLHLDFERVSYWIKVLFFKKIFGQCWWLQMLVQTQTCRRVYREDTVDCVHLICPPLLAAPPELSLRFQ